MQLKKLWIDGYKNLNDTTINFDQCESSIAIIGNNGTGKSNLIEALLSIFVGVYYDTPADFSFEINYEAHGKKVNISSHVDLSPYKIIVDGDPWLRSRFKARIRKTEEMPPFPSFVFGYYSGTCTRIEKLLKRYERTFSSKIRRQSTNVERNFVFSDMSQAKWILLSLIAHQHYDLLGRMSVTGASNLKITLKPPRNYNPESEDIILWNTEGAVRDFLSALENHSVDSIEKRYDSGDAYVTQERRYIFSLGDDDGKARLEKIASSLKTRSSNLYSMLQALHSNGMLLSVEYEIESADSKTFPFDALSEGEKQLLCVIGGLTMAQHQECLVLLDEPDTHLNPNWSWEYYSLLKEALHDEQLSNSTVLLATHDPVIISGLHKEQVLIAHKKNGSLTYERPHRDPRGQGIANVLTSEFFGLPSSLDAHTQGLLDERLSLAYKPEPLNDIERLRLENINLELKSLGLSINFRDPTYIEFEKSKYSQEELK